MNQKKPAGYAFEPIVNNNAANNNEDDGDVDENILPILQERLNNTEWCTCGRCSVGLLTSAQECICCHEIECVSARRNGINCIIENPRFTWFCTDSEGLETALSNMLLSRGNANRNNLNRPLQSR